VKEIIESPIQSIDSRTQSPIRFKNDRTADLKWSDSALVRPAVVRGPAKNKNRTDLKWSSDASLARLSIVRGGLGGGGVPQVKLSIDARQSLMMILF